MENFYKALKVIKVVMHTSEITDICFLDINQKTFQVWKRFYETFKSVYTNSCLSFENWQSLFLNDS